eukprot:Gb_01361 [translate_table: standard]
MSNASPLNEGTAAVEAMAMCNNIARGKKKTFLIARPSSNDCFGRWVRSKGEILDYTDFIRNAHANGVEVKMVTNLLALTMLKPPGKLGADMVIGFAQRFDVPFFDTMKVKYANAKANGHDHSHNIHHHKGHSDDCGEHLQFNPAQKAVLCLAKSMGWAIWQMFCKRIFIFVVPSWLYFFLLLLALMFCPRPLQDLLRMP